MVRPRNIALLVVPSCLIFATSASWADTSVHGLGAATLGWTDNMLGTSDDPPPGEPAPTAVTFMELIPGVLVFHLGPNTIHRFTFAHPITLYFGHSDANSHADIAAWHALHAASARDEITLGATMSRSSVSVANLRRAPAEGVVEAQPLGATVNLELLAEQGWIHALSPDWSTLQHALARAIFPLDTAGPEANRYLLETGLGLEYAYDRNALALVGTGSYFVTTAIERDGEEIAPARDQVLGDGRLRYRRDLTEQWSFEVAFGGAGAVRANDFGGGIFANTWLTAVRFYDERGAAEVSYGRAVTPSILTSRLFLTDTARFGLSLPLLGEDTIMAASSGGYSRGRGLETDLGIVANTVESYAVDASLTWNADNGISTSLRYQHLQQNGDITDFDPLPTYTRNVIMVEVGGMYPYKRLPRVPRGAGTRVDRTDRSEVLGGAGATTHRGVPRPGSSPDTQ